MKPLELFCFPNIPFMDSVNKMHLGILHICILANSKSLMTSYSKVYHFYKRFKSSLYKRFIRALKVHLQKKHYLFSLSVIHFFQLWLISEMPKYKDENIYFLLINANISITSTTQQYFEYQMDSQDTASLVNKMCVKGYKQTNSRKHFLE